MTSSDENLYHRPKATLFGGKHDVPRRRCSSGQKSQATVLFPVAFFVVEYRVPRQLRFPTFQLANVSVLNALQFLWRTDKYARESYPIHDRLLLLPSYSSLRCGCCCCWCWRSRYDCLEPEILREQNGFLLSFFLFLPASIKRSNFMRSYGQTMHVACTQLGFKCQVVSILLGARIARLNAFLANELTLLFHHCVATVLQIIASAPRTAWRSANKPSACHSFDDIFGGLT